MKKNIPARGFIIFVLVIAVLSFGTLHTYFSKASTIIPTATGGGAIPATGATNAITAAKATTESIKVGNCVAKATTKTTKATSSTIKNSKTKTYKTIQGAVDAAEESSASILTINICAGIYEEDVVIGIAETKTIKFVGQAKGKVTVRGTGNESNVFTIANACVNDNEKICYGNVYFQNINIKKISSDELPTRAIFSDNPGFCVYDTCENPRATLSFSNGEINGLKTGIMISSKVDLKLDKAIIKNINGTDTKAVAIYATTGGEAVAQSGNAEEQECPYDESPDISITNSSFYDNYARYFLIYMNGGKLKISNSNIYRNEGGGLALITTGCTDVKITGTKIYENKISSIFNLGINDNLDVESSEIYSNTSTWNGTFALTSGDVTITDSDVHDNTTTKDGGAVYYDDGDFTSAATCWSDNSPEDVYHETTAGSYNFECNNFTCDASGCR